MSASSVPPERRDSRRAFVAKSLAIGAAVLAAPRLAAEAAARESAPVPAPLPRRAQDSLFDKSAIELQGMMTRGTLSSRVLTEFYLARIESLDRKGPNLRSVIELNPDALSIAEALDAERAAGKLRGPLHGIPVLVKDNIDTADRMRTSAGSLALAESTPAKDAFIVERLRAAGAVLLGKTNLSEWANFRSTRSTSGWSGRGGQTKNPYVLDRNPCGSSSGTGAAISADLAAIGIGTETDGSIICPASINGIVGIKPTVGLWSRSGIIPISASQDTAGPMARTVADAAMMLGVLTGVDARDRGTNASRGKSVDDYSVFVDPEGLRGARIGVARNLAGFNNAVDAAFERSIQAMAQAGAIIVDKANLTTAGKFDEAEGIVLDYEFKAGLNAYLAALGERAPVKSLSALIAWNEANAVREMPWFGQEIFLRAEKRGPLTDAKYLEARATCIRLARTEGIDAVMAKHRVDAIICPSNQPAWTTDLLNGDHFTGGNTSFAAVAGYPSLTVPMGFDHELPLGLSFIGSAWSEGKLIKLASGFERKTRARRSPQFLPSLG
jgi:amidase